MTLLPALPLVGVKLVMVGRKTTVKFVELVPVPNGDVTEIGPVVAPEGTVAVICVAEFTVKLEDVPLNFTAVAPVKFAPVMVTVVPIVPLVGVKLVIDGPVPIVKFPELATVPPHAVTEMGPVVVPEGTVAVICVDEFNVKLPAVPLKLTLEAPVKFVPVMVTLVPADPLVGVKLVIVGAEDIVKFPELVPVPAGVVTEIFPVVAPEGTVAVIWVAEFTVKFVATVFLNFTVVAPVKFVPVIVTIVPAAPQDGVKPVTVGGVVTVKLLPLVAAPAAFVTVIGPLVAEVGTVAVICVVEFTV